MPVAVDPIPNGARMSGASAVRGAVGGSITLATMSRKITVSLPDASLREYLQPHPDVTILEWDLTGEPPLPRIEIVVPPYMGGPQVLQGLESVETSLVQSQSIGYDGVEEFLPAGR